MPLRASRLAPLVALGVAAFASASAAQPASDAPLLGRLHAFVDSLTTRDEFSGVVLVARGGTPVFHRAYGLADRERRVPNDTSTAFNVSSIGKLFTQAAIQQLVAQGKVHLDSTLGRYWPDYPNVDARRATIRQMLDHRSGIDGDIFARPATMLDNRDYLPLVVNVPLAFAPGSGNRYSNAGYVVLGEVVSRVSGEDYYDYVARHVFAPARMTRTGFPPPSAPLGNTATGYTTRTSNDDDAPRGPLHSNAALRPARGSAAGGAFSTTGDLLRFVVARRAGQLGFPGMMRREAIAGGSPGSNGVVLEGLPGDYDLIVLANRDPQVAIRIADAVEGWLSGGERPGGRRELPPVAGGADMTAALPDSPAGRAAREYIAAFNSGDAATMRRFMDARVVPDPARPFEARVAAYATLFGEQGALTLVGAEARGPLSVRVITTAAKTGPLAFILNVEPEAPHRIAGLQFEMRR